MLTLQRVLAVVFFAVAMSGSVCAHAETTTRDALLEAIEEFVDATNVSDTTRVSRIMHADARVVVHQGEKLPIVDRATYLALLGAGKIGGRPRALTMIGVQEDGMIGAASFWTKDEDASLHYHALLTRVGESWRIMSIVARLELHEGS